MIYINTLYGHEHTIHAAKISSALQRIGWYIWCTKMVLLLHLVQCGGAGWWYHMWMVMVWCYIYTIPNTSPPPLLHQIIIHFAPARAAATKMQLCMYTKVSLSLKPRWWCDILWCIYGSRMPIFPREGCVAELVRSKARRIYVLSEAFRFDMCARKNPIEFRKTRKNELYASKTQLNEEKQ